ncbi:putative glycosyl transferase [Arsenicicoccus piscis]|uniref:Glycosyl transferase n=2 Tax=Arsenicicoccus piscis TaxID=673954 RepID=A0ABQ6HVR5_9MICO|nr:glycosyltransferase family 4 protein [Arsenicicoccus piscis]GMA19698.1 putative glycosyl transferase [Arsenicicoccus piscis]GMA21963.1 putative glycosyl transferase [Arsenicicoccus piscis]
MRRPRSGPRSERLDGYRILRQGSRTTVYPRSLMRLRRLARREGAFDVVIDTQNGLPFAAPLATSTPVIALVHHVHKEQWPVVFGPLVARLGWLLESRVAPRIYRGHQYVAVSARTRDELGGLGVDLGACSVIHNGTDLPFSDRVPRSSDPRVVVLGRLVPHKRVERAIDVVARLRHRFPGIRLRVVGDGWWREQIIEHAERVGAADLVDVLGFVDEATKHHELASAWVGLAPSVKEGWGLNVVEAAAHGVPTVAFHGAGGLSESIVDNATGLLAHDVCGLTEGCARLLADHELRGDMALAAREHARRFTWEETVERWDRLVRHTAARRAPVAEIDHVATPPAVLVGRHRRSRPASA